MMEFVADPFWVWVLVGIVILIGLYIVVEPLMEFLDQFRPLKALVHTWSVHSWEPETRKAYRRMPFLVPIWLCWTFLTFIPVGTIMAILIGLGMLKDTFKDFGK